MGMNLSEELLNDTYKHIAEQYEMKGNLKKAEHYYVEAQGWVLHASIPSTWMVLSQTCRDDAVEHTTCGQRTVPAIFYPEPSRPRCGPAPCPCTASLRSGKMRSGWPRPVSTNLRAGSTSTGARFLCEANGGKQSFEKVVLAQAHAAPACCIGRERGDTP